ncbi:Protein gast1 [Dionaea muscipula]
MAMAMARKLWGGVILLCAALMFVLLAEHQVHASKVIPSADQQFQHEMYGTTQGSLRPQECGPRCGMRCSATSFKKPCMFFCQKCCSACLCVPPGTYGNKQVCPCYNNWKTKRGGPKCP